MGHANPRNYQLGIPVTTVHCFLLLLISHFPLHQHRELKKILCAPLLRNSWSASFTEISKPPKGEVHLLLSWIPDCVQGGRELSTPFEQTIPIHDPQGPCLHLCIISYYFGLFFCLLHTTILRR